MILKERDSGNTADAVGSIAWQLAQARQLLVATVWALPVRCAQSYDLEGPVAIAHDVEQGMGDESMRLGFRWQRA